LNEAFQNGKMMLLYEQYESFDWKDSRIYPDFKNCIWGVVKKEDVMAILDHSRRTAHDYLAVLKNFVGQ